MSSSAGTWRVEVFYDGECPLCMREIRWLKRLDRRRNIRFTDIAAADFSADSLGISQATLMARIHGRLPTGQLIQGVEVFRELYSAVGWRALVWLTRLPGVAPLLELGYRWFAANRLRWTGRCEAGVCQTPVAPR